MARMRRGRANARLRSTVASIGRTVGPTAARRAFNRTRQNVRESTTRKRAPQTGTSGVKLLLSGDISNDKNQGRAMTAENAPEFAEQLARWADIHAGRMPSGEPIEVPPDADELANERALLIRQFEDRYADADSQLAAENRANFARLNRQADELEEEARGRGGAAMRRQAHALREKAKADDAEARATLDAHAALVRAYREDGSWEKVREWEGQVRRAWDAHLDELREGLTSEIKAAAASWCGMVDAEYEFE